MRIITTLTRQTRQYTINLIWIAFLLAEHNGQITTTTKTTIRSRNFSMSNNFASKIFFVSHCLNARCDWIQCTKRGKVNARDGIYFLFSQSCRYNAFRIVANVKINKSDSNSNHIHMFWCCCASVVGNSQTPYITA